MFRWALSDLDQRQGPSDVQVEATTRRLLDAQVVAALFQSLAEEDEARLQVVLDVGELERGIEPDFLITEVDAPFRLVHLQQPPEDGAGNSFDEVLVVEERAAVGGEVTDRQRRSPAIRTCRSRGHRQRNPDGVRSRHVRWRKRA